MQQRRTVEQAAAPAAGGSPIRSLSAITLATHDMAVAVAFYRTLGFEIRYGGAQAGFTSFAAGSSHLNLVLAAPDVRWTWWGRAIFYVDDVDALFERALAAGLAPATRPADAPWRERFFHIKDPDGHEISFAQPLQR